MAYYSVKHNLDHIDRIDSIIEKHFYKMAELDDELDKNLSEIRAQGEIARKELELRKNAHLNSVWNQIHR